MPDRIMCRVDSVHIIYMHLRHFQECNGDAQQINTRVTCVQIIKFLQMSLCGHLNYKQWESSLTNSSSHRTFLSNFHGLQDKVEVNVHGSVICDFTLCVTVAFSIS